MLAVGIYGLFAAVQVIKLGLLLFFCGNARAKCKASKSVIFDAWKTSISFYHFLYETIFLLKSFQRWCAYFGIAIWIIRSMYRW